MNSSTQYLNLFWALLSWMWLGLTVSAALGSWTNLKGAKRFLDITLVPGGLFGLHFLCKHILAGRDTLHVVQTTILLASAGCWVGLLWGYYKAGMPSVSAVKVAIEGFAQEHLGAK